MRLSITLTGRDSSFLPRLASGYFAAVPLSLPLDSDAIRAPLYTAGPYYVQQWTPDIDQPIVLARNPYWNRKLVPRRPAYVDRIVYRQTLDQDEATARVERGETDVAYPAPTAALVRRYGLNRGRLVDRPNQNLALLSLNRSRPLFRDNDQLAKALNYAVDRPEALRAWGGALSGRRTDQILQPGMPGYRDYRLYPLGGANVAKARALARGHLRDRTVVMYSPATARNRALASVVAYNLRQIGLEPDVHFVDGRVLADMFDHGDHPWDVAVAGWTPDYIDPASMIDLLFYGPNLKLPGNHNWSHLDDPAVNRRIEAARLLTGRARTEAYAKLDYDLMREHAPIVPLFLYRNSFLVSAHVGCGIVMQQWYWDFDPVAACKK
jgi:peptide/nickel transport system substrate-binding protein